MAQLNSLIVSGTSRFLNTVYCNDIEISGSLSAGSLSLSGNLSVTGTSTLTGHVSVGGYNNTSYDFSANSAVINDWIRTIGNTGWYNQTHGGGWYMTNTSYIRPYNKPVWMDKDMYFGTFGSASPYFFKADGTIKANSITATSLNTEEATFENLNVSDTLRAARYSLETVQSMGGNLLVSPTLEFPMASNSTFSVNATLNASTNKLTLVISDSNLSTDTYDGAQWTPNSYVKVGGSIGGIALGTCNGVLTSWNLTSRTLTLSLDWDAGQFPTTSTSYSASQIENLTVMLYKLKSGSNLYPLGIILSAYSSDKNSSIAIYNGGSTTPTVKLGKLDGLPNLITGITPTGWGLYTNNGFFSGKVVSTAGQIGNWNISTNLYSGNSSPGYNTSTVVLSTGTASSYDIGGSGATSHTWSFTAGRAFGVTSTGDLYANSAHITGEITATSGTIGGASITNGVLKVAEANISGTLSANVLSVSTLSAITANMGTLTSGTIVGGTITTDASRTTYYSTSAGLTMDASGIGAGNGTSNTFKVEASTGKLTATGADITGAIKASSGYIGNNAANKITIGSDATYASIYSGSHSSLSSTVNGFYIGSDGISIGSKFKYTGGTTNSLTIDTITATNFTLSSGSINGSVQIGGTSGTDMNNNITAAQTTAENASYSVEIKVTDISYTNNTATLVAVPYYQGSATLPSLPTGVSLHYTWYKDSVGTSIGTDSNTLNVTSSMGLDHSYICVISTSNGGE